jgi:hypothetical protein
MRRHTKLNQYYAYKKCYFEWTKGKIVEPVLAQAFISSFVERIGKYVEKLK